MEKLEKKYILGLVDGEGSFTVYVKNPNSRKKVKRRNKVEPKFYVKLAYRDKQILFRLKNFLNAEMCIYRKIKGKDT